MKEDAFNSGRESSLHSSIKKWYLLKNDKVETKIDNFIIDIVRGDLLIEIQTANFSALKPKLVHLLRNHKVRIVYPVPKKKWIVHKSAAAGETVGRRLSPKKGDFYDVFSELIRIPTFFSSNNLSIEVLMIEMEEMWRDDGRGSWRRRGASVEDRKLIRVFETKIFRDKTDFLEMLPEDLEDPFSNKDLAKSLRMKLSQSRKMTYALKRMELIDHVGYKGRQMLFARGSRSTR